jgi:hypothetical protein
VADLSEDVHVTCGAFPVQIEGRLTDGRCFYFRSRHERAQLGIGDDESSAVDATIDEPPGRYVERDLSHLGQHGAGDIAVTDAFALLREMVAELPGGDRD